MADDPMLPAVDDEDEDEVDDPGHGNRFPDQVKQVAYIIWVENGMDLKRLHRLLAEDETSRQLAGMASWWPAPNMKTLRRWCKKYYWESRTIDTMREMVPYRRDAAAIVLAHGALAAANTLTRVAAGVDIKPSDKIAIVAASKVVDMDRERGFVSGLGAKQVIDVDGITTMEELAEAERKLGSG